MIPTSKTLASRENRWLKEFRAALQQNRRSGDGLVGVEGVRLVAEALRSGLDVPSVLFSNTGRRHLAELQPWISSGTQMLQTSDVLFAGIADTRTPQGVAALVRIQPASFDDVVRGGNALVVVLVGVQDPGNVGTAVRSAEGLGATGLVACRGTADPFSPKALRGSAGSGLRLPILTGVADSIVLAQLRMAGVKTFAATQAGGAAPAEIDLRGPAAILIGNEGAGLPGEMERSADVRISIPLASHVESLNAGVAASLILYEAARQRTKR